MSEAQFAQQPGPAPVIRYEDEHLAVVAKPAGLVVHPATGRSGPTLVDYLAERMQLAPAEAGRAGIVHRLDRGTSGLLVVAKDAATLAGLQKAIAGRRVKRGYLALVSGSFEEGSGKIEAPVGRSPTSRTQMAVVMGGRFASTLFEVAESFDGSCLLALRLETGRTHQIRVHLAHIGHPVLGDRTYGGSGHMSENLGLTRPFLHAANLAFVHPTTGAQLDIAEPLPADLQKVLDRLRFEARAR